MDKDMYREEMLDNYYMVKEARIVNQLGAHRILGRRFDTAKALVGGDLAAKGFPKLRRALPKQIDRTNRATRLEEAVLRRMRRGDFTSKRYKLRN